MKTRLALALCFIAAVAITFTAAQAKSPIKLKLLESKKVWDKAPHNAFTDLVRFQGKWFMTFREATNHMYASPSGNIRVLSSPDGETWESAALIKYGSDFETFLPQMASQDRVNEAVMIFRPDGSAVVLIRRDGRGAINNAIVGTSKGDLSKWTFKELKQRIGGPQIVEVPGGHILASGRLYDKKVRTSVGLLEPEKGKFTELVKLPSGGDCSYPGMVFHDGILWVSYYSSHEGSASIYLAKIAVK